MFKLENSSKMETILEREISKSITEIKEKFDSDEKTKQYEESFNTFRKLVAKGVIKERGNNLKSISETTKFNNNLIFNISVKK